MHDRAMQALFKIALDPLAETLADRNSYGFRNRRSCNDAIAQCFLALCRKISALWIFEADIKACFDNIRHDWILKHIPINKTILHNINTATKTVGGFFIVTFMTTILPISA